MEVFGTFFLLQEQFSFTYTANQKLIHHSTPIKFPNTTKVINNVEQNRKKLFHYDWATKTQKLLTKRKAYQNPLNKAL